jgi:hypothetical protein
MYTLWGGSGGNIGSLSADYHIINKRDYLDTLNINIPVAFALIYTDTEIILIRRLIDPAFGRDCMPTICIKLDLNSIETDHDGIMIHYLGDPVLRIYPRCYLANLI